MLNIHFLNCISYFISRTVHFNYVPNLYVHIRAYFIVAHFVQVMVRKMLHVHVVVKCRVHTRAVDMVMKAIREEDIGLAVAVI